MSIRAQQGAKERTSIYAEEGSLAHAFAEWMLNHQERDALAFVGQKLELDGYAEPQRLTLEMAEGVQEYLDYCWGRVDQHADSTYVVERRVHVPTIAEGVGQIWGTTDFGTYSRSASFVEVIDFKYGAGYAVDIFRNKQLLIYVLGLIATQRWFAKWIKITIVQPRAFHKHGGVRSYVLNIMELMTFALDLDDAVDAVVNNPRYEPGSHCRWCAAAWNCPALLGAITVGLPKNFKDLTKPKDMTMDELQSAMDMADLLSIWIREVRAEAHHRLAAGQTVPGYKLVEKQARRKWDGDDQTLAKEIAAEFGLKPEQLLRQKLLGITDTEKLVLKGKRGDERKAAERSMAKWTVRDSSGYEVAAVTDDRDAVSVIADAFAGVRLPAPPETDGYF